MSLFGKPSLLKPSIRDSRQYARMFKGFFPTGMDRLRYLDNSRPEDVIAKLEPILAAQPGNWYVRYVIGDWYMRARRYVDALHVLLHAYRLRPRDPRSTYALATAYRTLARASLEGTDIAAVTRPYLARLRTVDPDMHRRLLVGFSEFDPKASADELERIGLTIDQAAARAMEYFEETLAIGTRSDETSMVNQSLQSMYSEFPHLEARVKARRRTNTGVFGPDRGGSGALWNEARDHYTRLRFLSNEPGRYRFELGEVIRLCQWAIAADGKDGDAHVLLANAYSLLDSRVAATATEPFKYLKWAASILQNWSETPLSQHPFTKNREIGQRLYASVIQSIQEVDQLSPDQVVASIRLRCEDDLRLALTPATFAQIRDELDSQPL